MILEPFMVWIIGLTKGLQVGSLRFIAKNDQKSGVKDLAKFTIWPADSDTVHWF